jgi:hypothetical protein
MHMCLQVSEAFYTHAYKHFTVQTVATKDLHPNFRSSCIMVVWLFPKEEKVGEGENKVEAAAGGLATTIATTAIATAAATAAAGANGAETAQIAGPPKPPVSRRAAAKAKKAAKAAKAKNTEVGSDGGLSADLAQAY